MVKIDTSFPIYFLICTKELQIPFRTYNFPSKPYKNRSTIYLIGKRVQNNGSLWEVFYCFLLFLLQVKTIIHL